MTSPADSRSQTLAYYNLNALSYAERTRARFDRDANREFLSRIPLGGRILDAGCGSGRDLREMLHAGYRAEGVEFAPAMAELARTYSGAPVMCTDFQLLSPVRESFDGIWAHRSLVHLPPPGVQRVMGIFFAAIRPTGVLFVSIDEGHGFEDDRTDDASGPARRFHFYRADDFASLIRQSGFRVLAQGRNLEAPRRIGFIAERL